MPLVSNAPNPSFVLAIRRTKASPFPKDGPLTGSAWRLLVGTLVLSALTTLAQPYDFGYVPSGTTNSLSPLYWSGGSVNGTQLVMAAESILGPNAPEFATNPNYAGQTLNFGQQYPFSVSFAPTNFGFASGTLTNFEVPSPPFGGHTMGLQGTGIPAARPGSGPIVPELAPLEQAMTNYLVTHQFEAGTIALMHDSKLVLRQGYGWSDTNFSTVIHPDNLFRLASVSKMLTASAVYKLVDAGRLSTGTKVYSYLGIPPWGGVLGDSRITNITVQNLLDHSGGWNRDTSPVGDAVFSTIAISSQMGLGHPAAPTNVISWMFSQPLDFAPGTTNVYSNFGYQILGRVIEKASGKRYLDYIQQDLLGPAVLLNPLGFTNVVAARSRPADRAPGEIWYANQPQFLARSAVDYPAGPLVRDVDGGLYFESFDSFGGMCASAAGLCRYLLNYWEGGAARLPGENYSWSYIFYGSLPGVTSVLYQDITENSTSTNGLEFAALFNERDSDPNDNEEAETAIVNAASSITSWPASGGGSIQWSAASTNVNKNAGSVTVSLTRSGASTLPVKVSFTTYPLTAGSSNYTSTAGVVAFGAGVTSQIITVPLLNDGAIDPPKTFSLELLSASGGAWLGDRVSCVVSIIDTNLPPQFVGPLSLQPGGYFQAQFRSGPGLLVTIERSTNLVDWSSVQTFTNASGLATFVDSNALKQIRGFYRAVVP